LPDQASVMLAFYAEGKVTVFSGEILIAS